MAGPWFTVHRSEDDWQTMDTIWISNGATNDRAVVQGRVFLENPEGEASLLSSDDDLDHAETLYGDLALGAGAQVADISKLNFATHRQIPDTPENTIGPADAANPQTGDVKEPAALPNPTATLK